MLLGMSGKTRKTHIQRTHTRTHTNTEVSRKAYGTKVSVDYKRFFFLSVPSKAELSDSEVEWSKSRNPKPHSWL